MSFRVVVTELRPETEVPMEIERFRQIVDQIDIAKVFLAINTPPKPKRVRKAKAENG